MNKDTHVISKLRVDRRATSSQITDMWRKSVIPLFYVLIVGFILQKAEGQRDVRWAPANDECSQPPPFCIGGRCGIYYLRVFREGCEYLMNKKQNTCNQSVQRSIYLEKQSCALQLRGVENRASLTVASIGENTRFCIGLNRTLCEKERSCFWEKTLKVAEKVGTGGCLSLQIE